MQIQGVNEYATKKLKDKNAVLSFDTLPLKIENHEVTKELFLFFLHSLEGDWMIPIRVILKQEPSADEIVVEIKRILGWCKRRMIQLRAIVCDQRDEFLNVEEILCGQYNHKFKNGDDIVYFIYDAYESIANIKRNLVTNNINYKDVECKMEVIRYIVISEGLVKPLNRTVPGNILLVADSQFIVKSYMQARELLTHALANAIRETSAEACQTTQASFEATANFIDGLAYFIENFLEDKPNDQYINFKNVACKDIADADDFYIDTLVNFVEVIKRLNLQTGVNLTTRRLQEFLLSLKTAFPKKPRKIKDVVKVLTVILKKFNEKEN